MNSWRNARRFAERMKDKRKGQKEKYETCTHSESVGQYAVFVKPSCPRASMVKGRMVSSKDRCRGCESWKGRKDTCQK